jgi:hypothetical protein
LVARFLEATFFIGFFFFATAFFFRAALAMVFSLFSLMRPNHFEQTHNEQMPVFCWQQTDIPLSKEQVLNVMCGDKSTNFNVLRVWMQIRNRLICFCLTEAWLFCRRRAVDFSRCFGSSSSLPASDCCGSTLLFDAQKSFGRKPQGRHPAEHSRTTWSSGCPTASLGLPRNRATNSALHRLAAGGARTLGGSPLHLRLAGGLRFLLRNLCHCISLFLFSHFSVLPIDTNRYYLRVVKMWDKS